MRLTLCLGLGLISGATPPTPPPTAQPAAPRPMASAEGRALDDKASPLDEPLRLVGLARKAYADVEDYSCTLIKRERLEGKAGLSDSVLQMLVRVRPFSVSLRWQEPRDLAGQEACYVEGRNDGKMRVRSSGMLGAVGFVTLAPDDPRARKNSRHAITEAGLGNLIERYAAAWQEERRLGRTTVHVAAYEFNKRRCIRVETVHPGEPDGRFAFYRSVVYFDQETHLPARVECFDWPRFEGDTGEPVEVYSYVNLRLNVGVGDQPFDK